MDPRTKKTIIRHTVVFFAIVIVLTSYLWFFKERVYVWTFFTLYTLLTIVLHYYYVSKQKVRLQEMIMREEDMLKQKEESASKTVYLKSLRKKKILEEQTKAVHTLIVAQNHKINTLLNGIIGYSSILSGKLEKSDFENKDALVKVVAKIKDSGDSINKMMKEFDDPDSRAFKEIFETKEYLDLEKEYLDKDLS
jgi:signal transduction histidine kinase